MNILEVDTLDLPGLEPYRTLRRPEEHIQQGIFVAEGDKVVRRLLESDLVVLSLLLTREWLNELEKEHPLDIPHIFVAPKRLLETIVGYPLHQGIMAVGRVPNEPELDSLLIRIPRPYLLVALDGIVSAENAGVIIRNSAAFGADGILAGTNSSSPYLRRAVRNSMGAIFKLPVIHTDLVSTLKRLKPECKIIAATPSGSESLYGIDGEGNLCVVFGNEGTGITTDVLAECTSAVAIPMLNQTDSLNVASASAVFLYEIRRHRS